MGGRQSQIAENDTGKQVTFGCKFGKTCIKSSLPDGVFSQTCGRGQCPITNRPGINEPNVAVRTLLESKGLLAVHAEMREAVNKVSGRHGGKRAGEIVATFKPSFEEKGVRMFLCGKKYTNDLYFPVYVAGAYGWWLEFVDLETVRASDYEPSHGCTAWSPDLW